MPHLDEGTLHALLDGELELGEVKEIQIHLGACAACGSRLQDVKEFLAEADRLVGAMETPAGGATTRRAPAPPPAAPFPPPPPAAAKPWREPVWDSAPELLLPEDPEEVARRRRWTRRFRLAAMAVLTIGAVQLTRSIFAPGELELLNDSELISAAPETPPPVVSPEETMRSEQNVTRESPPRPAARARAPRPTAEPKAQADQPAGDTAADDLGKLALAAADTEPTPVPAPVTAERADTAAAEAAEPAQPEPSRQTNAASDLATRQAAAAALEELDRERIRARANAATASLPPTRPEPQAVEAPPPPRTLEQKAQIYLRIGLDEANKQLGRPMHVIEAMSPEFIGLAQGRNVPGADPNRPVVRVVYRDTRGRMILLDQQRMRTGQAPGAAGGNLRWALGDVMLYLHGEPGTDVLRNLQRRVR